MEQTPVAFGMIPYRFTAKEWDPETRLYAFPARYYDPKRSRWMSADPAGAELMHPESGSGSLVSGLNWYSYSRNNPVNYVDPTGLSDVTDEVMRQITTVSNEYADVYNRPDSPQNRAQIGGLDGKLRGLKGEYNRQVIAEGGLGASDYQSDGAITSGFGVAQDIGSYKTTAHPGIDLDGTGDLTTPFFTELEGFTADSKSNRFTLEIVGTDLKLGVSHADAESFSGMGSSWGPGQSIVPFPKKNNSKGISTDPHFHLQMSNGKKFYNPLSLKPAGTNFNFSTTGGRAWKPFSKKWW